MRTGFKTVGITQYLRLKNSITKRIANVRCFEICMLALVHYKIKVAQKLLLGVGSTVFCNCVTVVKLRTVRLYFYRYDKKMCAYEVCKEILFMSDNLTLLYSPE